MTKEQAEQRLQRQKEFFASGATLPVSFRKDALARLYRAIDQHEQLLFDALAKDLGKSPSESYMCEIGLVKSEIRYMLRHVRRFAREKRVATPMALQISRCFEVPSPYGSVLILSPWNYPFLLTLDPLVDAIAAGNTAIVKPSAYSPHTAAAMEQLLRQCFPPEYVAVVTGGRAENQCLMDLSFDSIFFTGGKTVGREVMRRAAERLIPVTLELGGKSPCIVDETANLSQAARSIVFGKFVNCGQTCVAPDYILCHESVKDQLIAQLGQQIRLQYGPSPLQNDAYGKIINGKHFARLLRLMNREKVAVGGGFDEKSGKIEPTVLDNVTWDDPVMGEEIFGPVLPVLTYRTLDGCMERIRSLPSPLALYIFSSDRRTIRLLQSRLSFGGGCINDTLVHLATSSMGFGGVGESGMGAYHGKAGFDAFTHRKSMVKKWTAVDLPMRYAPYSKAKDRLIRMFVK